MNHFTACQILSLDWASVCRCHVAEVVEVVFLSNSG